MCCTATCSVRGLTRRGWITCFAPEAVCSTWPFRKQNALRGQVNACDAQKLEEYFTSVRDVERKLQEQRDRLKVPTPQVDFELPEYDPVAPDLSAGMRIRSCMT